MEQHADRCSTGKWAGLRARTWPSPAPANPPACKTQAPRSYRFREALINQLLPPPRSGPNLKPPVEQDTFFKASRACPGVHPPATWQRACSSGASQRDVTPASAGDPLLQAALSPRPGHPVPSHSQLPGGRGGAAPPPSLAIPEPASVVFFRRLQEEPAGVLQEQWIRTTWPFPRSLYESSELGRSGAPWPPLNLPLPGVAPTWYTVWVVLELCSFCLNIGIASRCDHDRKSSMPKVNHLETLQAAVPRETLWDLLVHSGLRPVTPSERDAPPSISRMIWADRLETQPSPVEKLLALKWVFCWTRGEFLRWPLRVRANRFKT